MYKRQEWYRVTKKGGKVLYFDANWYYYLFNENEKKKHLENQKMVREKGGFIYNKSKIMENLAKVLPLSQTFRPDWDRETLPTLGYHNICLLYTSILCRIGWTKHFRFGNSCF